MFKTAISAMDIAEYILLYEKSQGRYTNNLRLQKLLYFCQAACLSANDAECFMDKIEAWSFGPVIPVVYNRFKINGTCPLTWEIEHFKGKSYSNIPSSIKETIDSMCDRTAQYSTTILTEITFHQQPWIKAYQSGKKYPFIDEITSESIQKYYT